MEVTFAGSESARSRPRRGRFEPPRGPKRAGGTLSGRARDRRGRKPRVRPSLRAETRARREEGSRTSSSSSLSSFEGGLLFPGGATLPSTSAAMFSAPCAEATRACPSERRERVRASTPPCARLALARAARRARTERAEADATRKSGVKKRTRRTTEAFAGSARDERTLKARSARPESRDRAFCGQKTRRERANCATAERDWSRAAGQNSLPCGEKETHGRNRTRNRRSFRDLGTAAARTGQQESEIYSEGARTDLSFLRGKSASGVR